MKTTPFVLFVVAAAVVFAQPALQVGSGHADTTRLSLLAPDIKPVREPAVYSLPRRTDITSTRASVLADRTDLIATVSDQQRVLRSLHIDPAPQPPAPAATKSTAHPLGNASQKR